MKVTYVPNSKYSREIAYAILLLSACPYLVDFSIKPVKPSITMNVPTFLGGLRMKTVELEVPNPLRIYFIPGEMMLDQYCTAIAFAYTAWHQRCGRHSYDARPTRDRVFNSLCSSPRKASWVWSAITLKAAGLK